jgi:hypothetical protein
MSGDPEGVFPWARGAGRGEGKKQQGRRKPRKTRLACTDKRQWIGERMTVNFHQELEKETPPASKKAIEQQKQRQFQIIKNLRRWLSRSDSLKFHGFGVQLGESQRKSDE